MKNEPAIYSDYEWLAAVVNAHPNAQLSGRTRLQKTMKLLQRLGLATSYSYSLHFYGPYSEDLQADISLLQNFGIVQEQIHSTSFGPRYDLKVMDSKGLPDVGNFADRISKLSEADSLVLELAATYDAYREMGSEHGEALERLKRKKGSKCDSARTDQALKLLVDLGLS